MTSYSYSYSYDPTHTLQYNLAPNFGLPDKFVEPEETPKFGEAEPETKVFENNLDKALIQSTNNNKMEEENKDSSENSKPSEGAFFV